MRRKERRSVLKVLGRDSGPSDPYRIPSGVPGRDTYRQGLVETLKLANLQYNYQIRRGLEQGFGYPRSVKNALARFDETIAEYKRGHLWDS